MVPDAKTAVEQPEEPKAIETRPGWMPIRKISDRAIKEKLKSKAKALEQEERNRYRSKLERAGVKSATLTSA